MIYNVPFSADITQILVDELFKRFRNNPLEMANAHLILPTKRACLSVKNEFMKRAKNGSLLPKLTPIYELDILNADIPPALNQTERLLLLAKLCAAKPNIQTFDQALKMAISLTELLDISYQFDLDLSHLDQLVDIERFASHWQETIQFLDILHTHWPKILKERGQIDPMDRIIRQIHFFTKEIKNNPEKTVFMAGFTNVFPAIDELIQSVANNKNNLVLTETFSAIDEKEKQFKTSLNPQEPIIIEALTKDNWSPQNFASDSLKNIQLIHANTSNDEALTIALLLRKVIETKEKTGILVTTDRNLARQVISQMKRWDVQLDDSAGIPLNHTDIGLYFSLLADLGLNPTGTNYLALLKHPLSADGQSPIHLRQLVQKQEKECRRLQQRWEMPLHTDLSKWISIFQNNVLIPFHEIITQHIEIAEKLATSSDKTASERLWQNDTGKQMFSFLTELLSFSQIIGDIESQTYPAILNLLMQQKSIRPRYGMHPRLDILGPIEARFKHADVCVIGGLNDGTFPPLPETGPWLNRPMRQKLNLPTPEEKTKELAIDFAHNFCSKEVYLTRATKVEGAQTVPSRFIQRLKAVAEINHLALSECKANLSQLVNTPQNYDKPQRPAPCPPVEVRPSYLPVTQIEMWRRNPYGIYARYILNLYPLTPLEDQSNKAEFGQLIHNAIQKFLEDNPHSTDRAKLIQTAEKIFENSHLTDIDKTLLNIKFSAIADFIISQQQADFDIVTETMCEEKIDYTFDVDGKKFTLSGRADRIDVLKDHSLRIIDYKNYHPPKKKEVVTGYAPQLVLEALLLSETQNKPVSTLSYWYLSNKKEDSEVQNVLTDSKEIEKTISTTKDGLFSMIRAFQNKDVPYEVCPIPSQAPHYNDYAHLARMQEWAVNEEEE